ncbi:hypothetical protein QTP70_007737 [Hemibagrus guttatus]|uniref:Alkylated DNA repair protein AlkB homologue 8 N-terminal domain-containing protein n=1 Tax=Hemibagrus guttatus TaxID=175788 RepID=A0AAE0R6X2_9TELE|nr:hypothetical protein QTP70_007737 [Hemibagrus guttatus]
MISIGSKPDLVKHVVSFRRFTYMILNSDITELERTLTFKIDACLDIAGSALTQNLLTSGVITLGHLVDLAGPELNNADGVAARLRQRSTQTVAQLFQKWNSALSTEEKGMLMEYCEGFERPDEEDPFPELTLSPDLEGSTDHILEWLIHLGALSSGWLTPAYRPNRSIEVTIAHLHQTALSQLDSKNGNYVKMLFVDYSSVFNTIIPSILTTKLEILGISPSLSTNMIKFADDTAVVSLISNNGKMTYLEEIKNLETWCQGSNLLLNVSRTKELIVDFSTEQKRNYQPLIINGTPVERVDSFQYLGVHITQDVSWSCHVNTLVKKAQQCLYHLRRLKDFKLPPKVLKTFYTCTIESILMGSITAWFGNSTKQDRRADLETIFCKQCWTKAK